VHINVNSYYEVACNVSNCFKNGGFVFQTESAINHGDWFKMVKVIIATGRGRPQISFHELFLTGEGTCIEQPAFCSPTE
jgi:hypothetical protein